MKQVTIIKRYDRNFRLPLYSLLKEELKLSSIDFSLIIGQPNKFEGNNIKDALDSNPFGPFIQNKYFYIGENFLSYQNAMRFVERSNLIIVQQSNSEILNYILLLKRNIKKNIKLAFWGHGINFQAKNKKSFSQIFKLYISKHVDHWFAYTKKVSDLLIYNGFPAEKITVLNNTIDVKSEKILFDSINEYEIRNMRLNFGIRDNDKVGIFCGSLYKLKGIEFLLKSIKLVRQQCNNFHFFVVGAGDMVDEVIAFENNNSQWFHYVGFKTGREKQSFLKIADFQMITGVVGLNIIDSFYSQTPLITIFSSTNSPEIEYLKNGKNGIITRDDLTEYANSVVEIIRDEEKLKLLKIGCIESSKIYTIEMMAENFTVGINKCLNGS